MKLILRITSEGDGSFDGTVCLINDTSNPIGLAFQTTLKELPNLGINLDLFIIDNSEPTDRA